MKTEKVPQVLFLKTYIWAPLENIVLLGVAKVLLREEFVERELES